MLDISSHCEARENQLREAGYHIADILKSAGVDRSSWTGWKKRGIRPRMDTFHRVEDEIERVLSGRKAAS